MIQYKLHVLPFAKVKRVEDIIFEKEVPPLPTRQQELNYIDNLEKEFRAQPWLSFRYRKLQAGPLRKPYERTRALSKEYRINYATNFMLGALISSPFAIWWGRRNRWTAGGVPMVYYPKNYQNDLRNFQKQVKINALVNSFIK